MEANLYFILAAQYIKKHTQIISALMFREATTRYGRDNLGLLWVIGEPLLFAVGVLIMWSFIRAPYENGVGLIPFLVTGYPPLILMRHTLSQGMMTIPVNKNILYHRNISILHLFISRSLIEIIGTTLSFVLLIFILLFMGRINPPKSYLVIYEGWLLLATISFGFALILGAVVALFEFFEKFAVLLTYVLIPFSGAFYMVAWLPYQYRAMVLRIPFVNCMEMIRCGFLGDFYPTSFDLVYTTYWAAGFVLVGLILLRFVRPRIDIE